MHIKALKAIGIPYNNFVEQLESLHSDLPEYITDVYSERKEVKRTEFSPNILSGVFGVTK